MHVFKSILGLLLMVQYYTLAFYVSLDEAIEYEWSTGMWVSLWITEALFAIDFFICFVTPSETMKNPDLKKTVIEYLKGFFLFDLVTTIISNMLFLFPGYGPRLWRMRLKLFRIFHFGYVRFSYKGIIDLLFSRIPQVGKTWQYALGLLIEMTIWLHAMTCIWIKLGSRDAYENEYLNIEDSERTWMFREGSDFSSD